MARQTVVIGAGLGGLSAAIHARLLGHEVLVLEQNDAPGGKASQIHASGYRLDPGPSIVILTEIYDAIFRAAGKFPEDYVRFERLDPFTRVFMEGEPEPVDLPADPEAFLSLLAEISPQDAQSMRSLLSDLGQVADGLNDSIFRAPIDQPWQLLKPSMARFARKAEGMRPYKEVIDRKFQSPLMRAFFYGFPSYGGQTFYSKSPGSLLIPYYMLTKGVWWPVGGIGAIPDAFYRLAQELGVEFRFGARVNGLQLRGQMVEAVNLEGGEVTRAERFISNRDRLTTRTWLDKKFEGKPSFSYFTLHLGVRRKMDGLKHHTLLIPDGFINGFEDLYDRRDFPRRPIVYLNETSTQDPGSAPDGCTNLFAVVTCPANEDHLEWGTRQEEYRRRVLREMHAHGFSIEEGDLDFCRLQTPVTFEQRDGNFKGSLYGPDEAHRLWGFMPLRCRDERVKNLFYCGGSVQPGAGMPMVTLSGRFAAELANR